MEKYLGHEPVLNHNKSKRTRMSSGGHNNNNIKSPSMDDILAFKGPGAGTSSSHLSLRKKSSLDIFSDPDTDCSDQGDRLSLDDLDVWDASKSQSNPNLSKKLVLPPSKKAGGGTGVGARKALQRCLSSVVSDRLSLSSSSSSSCSSMVSLNSSDSLSLLPSSSAEAEGTTTVTVKKRITKKLSEPVTAPTEKYPLKLVAKTSQSIQSLTPPSSPESISGLLRSQVSKAAPLFCLYFFCSKGQCPPYL